MQQMDGIDMNRDLDCKYIRKMEQLKDITYFMYI